jgi:hypothetical protein
MKKDHTELCFTWINISSEWNALCFTHNFTDFLLNVTLNGEQMDSKKIQLTSNFIEGLTKPFSIGLVSLFWGQITDFNVWNRPLANKELNQYSFGCQDRLSMQPEILDWSNTNITKTGVNATHFKIPLTCQNEIRQSPYFIVNANIMSFTKTIELCYLLKGDLFDPNYLDQVLVDNYRETFWVPIAMSGEFGKTQLGSHTINFTLTIVQEKGDQCMVVNIISNKYSSTACQDEHPSVCKVHTYSSNEFKICIS